MREALLRNQAKIVICQSFEQLPVLEVQGQTNLVRVDILKHTENVTRVLDPADMLQRLELVLHRRVVFGALFIQKHLQVAASWPPCFETVCEGVRQGEELINDSKLVQIEVFLLLDILDRLEECVQLDLFLELGEILLNKVLICNFHDL